MDITTWTNEQLLSLAPDGLAARAAEKQAAAPLWHSLGRGGTLAWGECRTSSVDAYRVALNTADLRLSCSCKARKRPCRHAVALTLLLAQDPYAFPLGTPPAWAATLSQPSPQPPADDAARAAYRKRLERLQQAVGYLGHWLRDMVHGGLAALPAQSGAYWSDRAAALTAAQAYELAGEVRDLRKLVGRHPAWPQELLRRVGRLYLLSQAFSSYERLSPAAQADLRAAAGWFPDPDQRGDERLTGRWTVVGDAHELQGSRNMRRLWLYGHTQRRFAYVEQWSAGGDGLPALCSGAALQATLRFAPGGRPLRAEIEALHELLADGSPLPGASDLRQARAAYGEALSLNPWLSRFPLALRDVRAVQNGDGWALSDGEGNLLPLPRPFLHGWHLQALSTVSGTALFGEWNGRFLTPLSVYYDGRWIALRVLRGQK